MREFWQSYSQNGYRAKVLIEWAAPDGVEMLGDRDARAEEIADDAASKLATIPYLIV